MPSNDNLFLIIIYKAHFITEHKNKVQLQTSPIHLYIWVIDSNLFPETNSCIRFVICSKSVFEKKETLLLVKWLRCRMASWLWCGFVHTRWHGPQLVRCYPVSTHYVGPITKSNGSDLVDLFFGENYQRRHAHQQTWDLTSPATTSCSNRSLFDSVNSFYDTCQHLRSWFVLWLPL